MKEKFEKLRDMASDVSDTTVEDGNTYTILSLCDQLVDAIDVYLEDQEESKKRPINYEIYLQDLTTLMNRYGDNNEKKENENE